MYNRLNTKQDRTEARAQFFATFNAQVTMYDDARCEIGVYDDNMSHPCAIYFDGTAGRPTLHEAYRNEERRAAAIERHLQRRQANFARKADDRANGRRLSDAARTAQAIRARLKAEFPEVVFKVTSDTFSMGDAVRISWTDGPVCSLVDAIVDEYQHGSFDGMTDCYNYRKIDERLGCPGVKWVSTSRLQSEVRKAELIAHYEANPACVNCTVPDGSFNAWLYENMTPTCWSERNQRRQADLEAQRAEHEAEPVEQTKDEPEEITFDQFVERVADRPHDEKPTSDSRVVNLANFRAEKERRKVEQQRSEFADLLESLALLTDEQLARVALDMARCGLDLSTRRDCVRHLLQILDERDHALAMQAFRECGLFIQ